MSQGYKLTVKTYPQTVEMYSPTHCRTVEMEFKTCPRCRGFGSTIQDADICHVCNGDGETWYDTHSGCFTHDKENIDIW